MKKIIACCLVLAPAIGLAQSGHWSAPVLGYVYDPDAKALRVLGGVPGAAGLETTLPSASKLESAAVSPARTFALAAIGEEGHLSILRISADAVTAVSLEGSLQPADLIAFNAGGDKALVYSKQALRGQLWTGLPDAPVLAWELEGAALAAGAVSDDGTLVAGAGETGLMIWSSSGAPMLLSAGSDYTAVVFDRNSRDLIAANAAGVQFIRNAGGAAEPSLLAGAQDGASDINALAISRDGRFLYAAGSSILKFDLQSKAMSVMACDCRPTELAPLAGNAVFRLTGLGESPLAILDADAEESRILFVPFAGGKK